jgi:hypothetical protein
MFKLSPAILQTFIDTRLTLTPSVSPHSNYVFMASDSVSLKYFCVFLYWNHQVYRDFSITLYIYIYIYTQSSVKWKPVNTVRRTDFRSDLWSMLLTMMHKWHEQQMVHTRPLHYHNRHSSTICPTVAPRRVTGHKQYRSQVSVAIRRQLASRRRLLTIQVFGTAYKWLGKIGREIGVLERVVHELRTITYPTSTWQCVACRHWVPVCLTYGLV